jgi:hypothetical protein
VHPGEAYYGLKRRQEDARNLDWRGDSDDYEAQKGGPETDYDWNDTISSLRFEAASDYEPVGAE